MQSTSENDRLVQVRRRVGGRRGGGRSLLNYEIRFSTFYSSLKKGEIIPSCADGTMHVSYLLSFLKLSLKVRMQTAINLNIDPPWVHLWKFFRIT